MAWRRTWGGGRGLGGTGGGLRAGVPVIADVPITSGVLVVECPLATTGTGAGGGTGVGLGGNGGL